MKPPEAREGRPIRVHNFTTSLRSILIASAVLALPGAGTAMAQTVAAAPSGRPMLSAMRSWSSPTSTRVVFDFSALVSPVAPDSGITKELVLTIPGEQLLLGSGVPRILGVHDGTVDSIEVDWPGEGTRIRICLKRETRFKVFPLVATQDKPFRWVVDVARPGGQVAEEKRIEKIAVAKKSERVRIVAVDAGHGGEDSGARGPKGVLEKRVTLAVAKATVDELNRIAGVKGVLIRDGDYFIPLRERFHKAEKMKADVFISIHANSSKRRGRGSGSEVYFLSLRGASSQADADLADLENAADLVGGVPSQAEDDLVNILYDVKRSSALQQSQLLADNLLDHLVASHDRLESRGVKQAGFAVLKSVEFPSALVETAFINNPAEAKLLANPEVQKKMGRQIATGVKSYFEKAGIALGNGTSSGATP